MKKEIVLLALSAMALGCSSDSTSPSSANPDPAACNKGSISVGDVKSGAITASSCLRYDYAYSTDSTPYDNYSFRAEKGKGYMFLLENANDTLHWDALLEMATINPTTGEEQLLAISDDEGGHGFSRMYFIAPSTGTYYIRAGAYDNGEFSSYKLTLKSCDSPIPQITDTLAASTQTLSASDCVLAEPDFYNDSSNVKLFSMQLGPNETKTVTVTSSDFQPGFQIYGPAWGVPCYYGYEGCGGGDAYADNGSSVSYTITADGDEECSSETCEFYNFPGQYTIAVGASDHGTGSFTIAVTEGDVMASVVAPTARSKNPTLNFLRKKPLRASEYFNRAH